LFLLRAFFAVKITFLFLNFVVAQSKTVFYNLSK